jgi:hypothetical protein
VKAISIRQPWAWLIVNGHKDVENRTWYTSLRDRVWIHASSGMTRQEYWDCRVFAEDLGVEIPAMEKLERGGIVGRAFLIGCVTKCESPWFFGPYGHVLDQAEPVPFKPCKGAVGYFEVADE